MDFDLVACLHDEADDLWVGETLYWLIIDVS